jgi:hypothetical protein
MNVRVMLLGGPFNGQKVELSRTPERIDVAGVMYRRIDDPDTGRGLDAYVVVARETKR